MCSTDSSCSAPRFDVPCVRASTSSGNTSDCPSSLSYSGCLIYEGSGSACHLETGESNFLLGNLSMSRKGSVFIHKCETPGGGLFGPVSWIRGRFSMFAHEITFRGSKMSCRLGVRPPVNLTSGVVFCTRNTSAVWRCSIQGDGNQKPSHEDTNQPCKAYLNAKNVCTSVIEATAA